MDETNARPDLTVEERIKELDRIQNVLLHTDWRDIHLMLQDDRNAAQQQMDAAPNWDSFVAARAVKTYLEQRMLVLRDLVAAEKQELEAQVAAGDAPLPPTDYELDQ
jgi:hypothetical protein